MCLKPEEEQAIRLELAQQFQNFPLAYQAALSELLDAVVGTVKLERYLQETGISNPQQAVLQFAISRALIWVEYDQSRCQPESSG